MPFLEDHQFPVGHSHVMRWAEEIGQRLPATHRHVLQALACFADEDDYACMSQERIAHHTRVP